MIFYLKASRRNCINSLRLAVVKSLWVIQEQSFTQQQDGAQSCGYRTGLTSERSIPDLFNIWRVLTFFTGLREELLGTEQRLLFI